MIQQDRFLQLLDALRLYEENHKQFMQAAAYAHKCMQDGSRTPSDAVSYFYGFSLANARVLTEEAVRAMEREQTYFRLNAKRNAKNRERVRLKKDLKAHNEYKAQRAMPWVGTLPKAQTTPTDQPDAFKHYPREELERMQAEAAIESERVMREIAERQAREGGPSVSPERQALAARMEELKAKLPKGKVFTDDEILGDTDGTEDPFGEA